MPFVLELSFLYKEQIVAQFVTISVLLTVTVTLGPGPAEWRAEHLCVMIKKFIMSGE